MKLRWKILITTGVVGVLATASLWVSMHSQPASELEAYKKLLRDHGEKLDVSQVTPPPVAPEDNSVDAVREAFAMFGPGTINVPNAMRAVGPGEALIGWNQPDARGSDFTNSWEQFATGVAADAPAIELLHQVLDRPKLDFQLDYSRGDALLLPHLVGLRRATQRLTAASVWELHDGESGAATTNILTILALVHNDAAEPLWISYVVRMARVAMAVVPTWELLQATNVTEEQLAALQKGWERLDFLADAENSFVMERASMAVGIQKSRASHEGFESIFGAVASMGGAAAPSGSAWNWPLDWDAITERPRWAIGEEVWRSSESYSAELHMDQSDQVVLETVRAMRTNRNQFYKGDMDAMQSRLSSPGLTNAANRIFEILKIPDFYGIFSDWGLTATLRKSLRIETGRRIVIAAIALKRFQLAHGKWPDVLADLTPQFLSSVPIDPYDGKPLVYHPSSDGTFLLYSVGEDGVDDGGDPSGPTSVTVPNLSWQDSHARDWVWPRPATPAEVEYFYEHPKN